MKLKISDDVELPVYEDEHGRGVVFLDEEAIKDLKSIVQDAIDNQMINEMREVARKVGMDI